MTQYALTGQTYEDSGNHPERFQIASINLSSCIPVSFYLYTGMLKENYQKIVDEKLRRLYKKYQQTFINRLQFASFL